MSVLLSTRPAASGTARGEFLRVREALRVRLIKTLCCLLLGVCFWFSVPYELPLRIDPDPKIAASNEAELYTGSRSRQIALPLSGLVGAAMLLRLPRRGRLVDRLGGKLGAVAFGYAGWVALSLSWSTEPAITGKRLLVFALDAFTAVALARTLSLTDMALLGFSATGTVALIALYADAVLLRTFAPGSSDYRFMGVMTANYQAMNLVVCLFCALCLVEWRPRWARWLWPAILFFAALLLLTRSRVSVALGIVLLGAMLLRLARQHFASRTRAILLACTFAIAVPALVYVVGIQGTGAARSAFMLGRTDTENTSNLSNRLPLWAELSASVAQRPWLGVGYQAFWTPARVEQLSADQGWAVPHAHNTYLDQVLTLGLPGGLLYLAFVLGAAALAWRRYRRAASREAMLAAVLLTWLLLEGVAESVPLDPYLPTMLAYACAVKMCLARGSDDEVANA